MDCPLISCLTPTYNRREFFPRAVERFQAQDYPRLEWIIVDDGDDPIYDLLPDDSRIKYRYEPPRRNHGQKMNRCFELSSGEIGIVWDDDDWYPADRITRQVQPLLINSGLMVSGTSRLYYYEHATQRVYLYTRSENGIWIGAIAIRKSAWEQHHFDDLIAGADYNFLKQMLPEARYDLNDPTLLVSSMHSSNAARKTVKNIEFSPVPLQTINVEACLKFLPHIRIPSPDKVQPAPLPSSALYVHTPDPRHPHIPYKQPDQGAPLLYVHTPDPSKFPRK